MAYAFISPPYLNNFDYSEIYKLELWMLDFVSTYEEWQKLRRSTIRSHHSLKFPQTNILRSHKDAQSIIHWIDFMASSQCLVGKAAENMPSVIKGYFDDMYLSLKEQFRVLKPGGFLVYVVSNSRHAYLPIATDLMLGHIAQIIGFEPLELVVLKKRNGRTRQKNFLRESAAFMRKPRG
jgi:DNA modification methylase